MPDNFVDCLTEKDIGYKVEFSDGFALYRGYIADIEEDEITIARQEIIDCIKEVVIVEGREYQDVAYWEKFYITQLEFINRDNFEYESECPECGSSMVEVITSSGSHLPESFCSSDECGYGRSLLGEYYRL